MALRLILFIIGTIVFTGFLWFFAQVLWLGTSEFFRRRNGVKLEENGEKHDKTSTDGAATEAANN